MIELIELYLKWMGILVIATGLFLLLTGCELTQNPVCTTDCRYNRVGAF